MDTIITSFDKEPLVVGAEGVEEVRQNVRIIVSTIKGTVPLDRDFGVDADILDSPTPKAMAKWRSEVIDGIEKYEPRVDVKEISFEHNPDGQLFPKVKISIKKEYYESLGIA